MSHSSSSSENEDDDISNSTVQNSALVRNFVMNFVEEGINGDRDMDEDWDESDDIDEGDPDVNRAIEVLFNRDRFGEQSLDFVSAELMDAVAGSTAPSFRDLRRSENLRSKFKASASDDLETPANYAMLKESTSSESSMWIEKVDYTTMRLARFFKTINYGTGEEDEWGWVPNNVNNPTELDWFFEKTFCDHRNEWVYNAVLIGACDGTFGCEIGLAYCPFPLLMVHLARSSGQDFCQIDQPHNTSHKPQNYPFEMAAFPVSTGRTLKMGRVYEDNEACKGTINEALTTKLGFESNGDSVFTRKRRHEPSEGGSATESGDCDEDTLYAFSCGYSTYLIGDVGRNPDVYKFLVDSSHSVSELAKRIHGLELKYCMGHTYVGAEELITKASLVFSLKMPFQFGQPSTPLDATMYKELLGGADCRDEVSSEVADKVESLSSLMRMLSSTIRPDLVSSFGAAYWDADLEGAQALEGKLINMDAFKRCLMYLLHTAESSMRFSASPTPLQDWKLECYVVYEPTAEPHIAAMAYSLFLNKEPLYWKRFTSGRERKWHLLLDEITADLTKSDIFDILTHIRGSEIPVAFKHSLDKPHLEPFESHITDRIGTKVVAEFEKIDPRDNLALLIAKPLFGELFRKQVRHYGLI